MPKPRLTATTTATVTNEVKLAPQSRRMLLDRLEEHERLSKQVKELNGKKTKKNPQGGRLRRLADEVQELFRTEKVGKALIGGTNIDRHRAKLVMGERAVFDQQGFMKKHGLSQADFDAFTELVPTEPYLKITHGDEEDE
jgi:hypothetical protein